MMKQHMFYGSRLIDDVEHVRLAFGDLRCDAVVLGKTEFRIDSTMDEGDRLQETIKVDHQPQILFVCRDRFDGMLIESVDFVVDGWDEKTKRPTSLHTTIRFKQLKDMSKYIFNEST